MSHNRDIISSTFAFYPGVGKLTDLAAVSVMAALMHHKITLMHRGNKKIEVKAAEVDLLCVTLPETIIGKIRDLSYPMNICRLKWWTSHWEEVFFRSMPSDDMITLFDQLVWLPNGSISFEQTARKLLNGDKLTAVQKFQMACSYCFVDNVNRLKETLSQDEIDLATSSCRVNSDPFLDYWCIKFYHLFDIWGLRDIDPFTELIRPRKYYDHHWPAIEFFWNLAWNEEERMRRAHSIIGIGEVKMFSRLFPKLTDAQLNSVLRESCRKIMSALANEYYYSEYMICIWKHMLNIIDDDSLVDILRDVNDMQNSADYEDALLWEMWLCLSERLKNLIAYGRSDDFMVKSIESHPYRFSPNYPLIIDILSRWSTERRRYYWTAHWRLLVFRHMSHLMEIEQIMNICLGNDENIAVFKRTVMIDVNSIKDACQTLLKDHCFEELQIYLNYCTSDQDAIRNLKRQIITTISKDDLFLIFFRAHLVQKRETELDDYLRDIFTANEVTDFVNESMCKWENLHDMLQDGYVAEVITFIERYSFNEENLVKIKLDFVKHIRELPPLRDEEPEIKVSDWVDLLAWCFSGNPSVVGQFKILLQPSDDVEMENDDHSAGTSYSIHDAFHDSYLRDPYDE